MGHGLIMIDVYTFSSSSFTQVLSLSATFGNIFIQYLKNYGLNNVREPTKKLLQFHNISNYPTTCSPQSAIQKNFKDPYVRWQIDLK